MTMINRYKVHPHLFPSRYLYQEGGIFLLGILLSLLNSAHIWLLLERGEGRILPQAAIGASALPNGRDTSITPVSQAGERCAWGSVPSFPLPLPLDLALVESISWELGMQASKGIKANLHIWEYVHSSYFKKVTFKWNL